jgi:hypothetical protein
MILAFFNPMPYFTANNFRRVHFQEWRISAAFHVPSHPAKFLSNFIVVRFYFIMNWTEAEIVVAERIND